MIPHGPLARRSSKLETSVQAEVHAFLEQVEHQYEPALATIRNHPFVQGVEQGTVPLVILRQFAHAEYWYMRGGVKHFALSIMAAPDLETNGSTTSASLVSSSISNASAPFCKLWGLPKRFSTAPGLPRVR
jgi:thiaminase